MAFSSVWGFRGRTSRRRLIKSLARRADQRHHEMQPAPNPPRIEIRRRISGSEQVHGPATALCHLLASEKPIEEERRSVGVSMKRCLSCGRRIWNSAVSIPKKGDYHYECAKKMGVRLSLEADPDAISRIVDEIKAEIDLMDKRKAEDADHMELGERLQRIHEKLDYPNTLNTVRIRKRQE